MEELTINQLQQKMSTGETTAVRLTGGYLARIQTLDPLLKSVLVHNPDALKIAEARDTEREKGQIRGPLHGIPILIKGNIDTGDRMETTAGSLAMVGHVAKQDSALVKQLRSAGAVILGKTNLSEWANFRSIRSSSGWSSQGGQTHNPYVLDRNPCGSSSGSAVAVSANLASVAVGTETDGSIVCPSHTNGIVGLKPTVGMVSQSGIIPISHSQDTAGPMTRTVEETAILLSYLVRAGKGSKSAIDYTTCLKADGLKSKHIGIAREYFGFNGRVDGLMEEAIDLLSQNGATIIDPIPLQSKQYSQAEFEVLLFEFKDGLNRYLSQVDQSHPIHSLQELIEFNNQHQQTVMLYFGQEILEMAQEKGGLDDRAYRAALTRCRRLSRQTGIDAIMTTHQLDAILAPTGVVAWTTDLLHGDPHLGGGSSSPAAVAGYPNITVPAGFVQGLPIGVSFFGQAYSEAKLIEIAYAFEQISNHRRPPRYMETLPDDL